MIVYEIWLNTNERCQFEFKTFEQAKNYGFQHYHEFYIQPKFVITDKDYFTMKGEEK